MRFELTTPWLFITAAAASPLACFNACRNTLHRVHFDDMFWNQTAVNKTCHSVKALTSLYLCVDLHCTVEARTVGLEPLNRTCQEDAHVAMPPFGIIANYSKEDVARLELEDAKKPVTYNEVVLPSEAFFKAWFDTLDSVEHVQHYHILYGGAMVIFWAVAIAIGLTTHFIATISNLQILQRRSLGPLNGVWNSYKWLSSTITVPATFGYRCAQKIGWGTVPPRIQSLTLLAFLFINVVFSIHGYKIVPVNIYFPSIDRQILRYVSDRTGIISFANFPMIWLFGMRNNILMWLTGWDFGTYNNFHRWVARIATVQAIVHSIGYTALIVRDGGWSYFWNWWTYMFFWAGELATIFMSLLVGFSFYWIRRQHYEFFLIVHIVMSIIVLVTMLGHVSIFGGMFDPLFWIPVFIWLADRALRVLRVLAFNPIFWNTRATANYNPSSNIVRLAIPWSRSLYKPAPGTYYYLHVLGGPRFWESHPFTVAAVIEEGGEEGKLRGEQVPLLEEDGRDPHADNDTESLDEDINSMTFLIRPYDGFTSRLRDMAASSWPRKAPLRVLVDGPYGHTQPFHLFDNVIFVVGGSGIVVPLSYLQLLTSSPCPTSVQIHWAVREPAFALEVLRADIGEMLGASNLSVTIHFTSHARDDMSEWPSQVTLRSGRIDARSTILAARAKAADGTLAVVACGPAQMADDARKTCVDLLGSGATGLEYFEESFQW